jgi:haloacetate dehalogenase
MDVTTTEIQTEETTIFVRATGSGPPILLLHGFPSTFSWRNESAMWLLPPCSKKAK